MQTDWSARHPIAFLIIVVSCGAVIFLVGGALLASFTGWNLKDFVTSRTTRIILDIPSILMICFLYRFITTGQIRHVQAPKTNVDSRKQEQDPVAP